MVLPAIFGGVGYFFFSRLDLILGKWVEVKIMLRSCKMRYSDVNIVVICFYFPKKCKTNATSSKKVLFCYRDRCQKAGWGYPSTGLSNVSNICQADKTWNLTKLEDCICKFVVTLVLPLFPTSFGKRGIFTPSPFPWVLFPLSVSYYCVFNQIYLVVR